MAVKAARREEVSASYLGFALTITEREVLVRAPDGRRVGRAWSVAGARCMVRGYRREGRRA